MDRDLVTGFGPEMIEVFELGFKRYTHQMAISEDVFTHLEFAGARDHLYDTIILGIRAVVLADDLPPEHLVQEKEFSWDEPASTWQMWKQRNAHRWYARRLVIRRPVRVVALKSRVVCEFDLQRFRLYPEAKVRPTDGRFGRVRFAHEVTNLNWRRDDGPR
jgi:hypothetical protein